MGGICGGGGSSNQQTTTNTSSPPPQILADYQAGINRATAVANTPYTPYPGEQVAPLSNQTQAGLSNMDKYAYAAQPYLDQAGNMVQKGAGMQDTAGQYQQQGAGMQAQAGAMQNQGYNTVGQGAGMIPQAGNMTLGAAAPVTMDQYSGDALAKFMNPYTKSVVDATQAQFNNQNTQQAQFLNSQNIGAGAFGGDRAGLSQAILANQQNLSQAPVIAGLNQANFNQATAEFNNQQQTGLGTQEFNRQQLGQMGNQYGNLGTALSGMGAQMGNIGQQYGNTGNNLVSAGTAYGNTGNNVMNAGTAYGNVGVAKQTQGTQGATNQINAGMVPQTEQQAIDNSLQTQWNAGQAYPFQTTSFLNNTIQGLGNSSGGTGTTSTPGASPLSQAIGAGTAIAGAAANFLPFSDIRVKENVTPIGRTFDGQTIHKYNYKGDPRTQIGLVAQEVEQRHPEAVHNNRGLGGLKQLDYDAATRESERGGFAGGGGLSDVSPGSLYDIGLTKQPSPQGALAMFGVPGADAGTGSIGKSDLTQTPGGTLFGHGQNQVSIPGDGSDLSQAGPYRHASTPFAAAQPAPMFRPTPGQAHGGRISFADGGGLGYGNVQLKNLPNTPFIDYGPVQAIAQGTGIPFALSGVSNIEFSTAAKQSGQDNPPNVLVNTTDLAPSLPNLSGAAPGTVFKPIDYQDPLNNFQTAGAERGLGPHWFTTGANGENVYGGEGTAPADKKGAINLGPLLARPGGDLPTDTPKTENPPPPPAAPAPAAPAAPAPQYFFGAGPHAATPQIIVQEPQGRSWGGPGAGASGGAGTGSGRWTGGRSGFQDGGGLGNVSYYTPTTGNARGATYHPPIPPSPLPPVRPPIIHHVAPRHRRAPQPVVRAQAPPPLPPPRPADPPPPDAPMPLPELSFPPTPERQFTAPRSVVDPMAGTDTGMNPPEMGGGIFHSLLPAQTGPRGYTNPYPSDPDPDRAAGLDDLRAQLNDRPGFNSGGVMGQWPLAGATGYTPQGTGVTGFDSQGAGMGAGSVAKSAGGGFGDLFGNNSKRESFAEGGTTDDEDLLEGMYGPSDHDTGPVDVMDPSEMYSRQHEPWKYRPSYGEGQKQGPGVPGSWDTPSSPPPPGAAYSGDALNLAGRFHSAQRHTPAPLWQSTNMPRPGTEVPVNPRLPVGLRNRMNLAPSDALARGGRASFAEGGASEGLSGLGMNPAATIQPIPYNILAGYMPLESHPKGPPEPTHPVAQKDSSGDLGKGITDLSHSLGGIYNKLRPGGGLEAGETGQGLVDQYANVDPNTSDFAGFNIAGMGLGGIVRPNRWTGGSGANASANAGNSSAAGGSDAATAAGNAAGYGMGSGMGGPGSAGVAASVGASNTGTGSFGGMGSNSAPGGVSGTTGVGATSVGMGHGSPGTSNAGSGAPSGGGGSGGGSSGSGPGHGGGGGGGGGGAGGVGGVGGGGGATGGGGGTASGGSGTRGGGGAGAFASDPGSQGITAQDVLNYILGISPANAKQLYQTPFGISSFLSPSQRGVVNAGPQGPGGVQTFGNVGVPAGLGGPSVAGVHGPHGVVGPPNAVTSLPGSNKYGFGGIGSDANIGLGGGAGPGPGPGPGNAVTVVNPTHHMGVTSQDVAATQTPAQQQHDAAVRSGVVSPVSMFSAPAPGGVAVDHGFNANPAPAGGARPFNMTALRARGGRTSFGLGGIARPGFLDGGPPDPPQPAEPEVEAPAPEPVAAAPAAAPAPAAAEAAPFVKPTRQQILEYNRGIASKYGNNPDVVTKVLGGEMGAKDPYQVGDAGSSFGPWQLHKGGINPAMNNPGMGDEYTKATGHDPNDPRYWQEQSDFAQKGMSERGLQPWATTAGKLGLGRWASRGDGSVTAYAGQDQGQQLAHSLTKAPPEVQYHAAMADAERTPDQKLLPPGLGDSLMMAGFAMMAGTSPNAMTNIGQGAMAGMKYYQNQRNLDREWLKNEAQIENWQADARYKDAQTKLETRQLDIAWEKFRVGMKNAGEEIPASLGGPEAAPATTSSPVPAAPTSVTAPVTRPPVTAPVVAGSPAATPTVADSPVVSGKPPIPVVPGPLVGKPPAGAAPTGPAPAVTAASGDKPAPDVPPPPPNASTEFQTAWKALQKEYNRQYWLEVAGVAPAGSANAAKQMMLEAQKTGRIVMPDGRNIIDPNVQEQEAGGEYKKKVATDTAEEDAKIPAQIIARQKLDDQLHEMQNLQLTFEPDRYAEQKGDIAAKVASIFGSDAVPQGALDNAESAQRFLKDQMNAVMSQVQAMGGKILVSEIEGFKRAVASPNMQPGAAAAITAQMRGVLKWLDAYDAAYGDWRESNPSAPKSRFTTQWIKQKDENGHFINSPQTYIDHVRKNFPYKGDMDNKTAATLEDGRAYVTKNGPMRWNAQKQRFFPYTPEE